MFGNTKHGDEGSLTLGVEIIAIVMIRKMGFARRAKVMSLKRREEMREELGIEKGSEG